MQLPACTIGIHPTGTRAVQNPLHVAIAEDVHASLDRSAQLTQRYLEVTQAAVMTATASAAERQAKMAA